MMESIQKSLDNSFFRKASLHNYFSETLKVFHNYHSSSSKKVDFYYEIGGQTLRLRFANQALISRIAPALEHRRIEDSVEASLTICLIDSHSTGMELPAPPWGLSDYLPRGDIRGYDHESICAIYQLGTNALSMLDHERQLAIYWVPNAQDVPYYESAAPLRALINLWMKKHSLFMVHAAGVGFQEAGVLLVGKGGSGKSTAALSCLFSDGSFLGDDYCLLSVNNKAIVYSLFCFAKKDAEDIARLPDLAYTIRNMSTLKEEKAVYSLNEHYPKNFSNALPLQAIIDVKIADDQNTILKKIPSSAALASLAPTTLLQLPGTGGQEFRKMAKLTQMLPTYQLWLGSDLSQVPLVIKDLLKTLH